MVTKLTKKEMIDEINQLRQQVIELQSEVIRLRQSYIIWPDDTTEDPLLNQPLNLCAPVCQGGRGY